VPYDTSATRITPALIIYLLDMSSSMSETVGGEPKIDVVTRTLQKVLLAMVRRSTRGQTVSPRYRVAILAYNNTVRDLFDGAIPVDKLVDEGIPVMRPSGRTDTYQALLKAEELLQQEWSNIQHCPAPLICHMTDGEYNDGGDPLPVARRIMQLRVPDGNVLLENIFFSDDALMRPVTDPYNWPGISGENELATDYARFLFRMSSDMPQSYRDLFIDEGYSVSDNAKLLFPGDTPEMVEAGFIMSGMTPTV